MLGALCSPLIPAIGRTQAKWPAQPIKLLVPFSAGGATDVLGRLLATGLSAQLGQAVIVENRPGAGTIVAASMLMKAVADGYTLMLGSNTTYTLNPAIRRDLPYDPLLDFTCLGMAGELSVLLLARTDTPLKNVEDLIVRSRSGAAELSYGSYGVGSTAHVGAEMLKRAAGIKLLHVPFNGSSQNLAALIGGQVDLCVDTVAAGAPLVETGKARALATFSGKRIATLPRVPTLSESGYPAALLDGWFGLVGPANLPQDISNKIEHALIAVLKSPAVQARQATLGMTPTRGDGAAMRSRIEEELPKIRAITAKADIRGE